MSREPIRVETARFTWFRYEKSEPDPHEDEFRPLSSGIDRIVSEMAKKGTYTLGKEGEVVVTHAIFKTREGVAHPIPLDDYAKWGRPRSIQVTHQYTYAPQ